MKNIFTTLSDGTLVTYNDIQQGDSGKYIPLYFEKPIYGGFAFLETSLPKAEIIHTSGFSIKRQQELLAFARQHAEDIKMNCK